MATATPGRFKSNSPGSGVAAVLAGVWRKSPPRLEMPAGDVGAITPLLLASGAGALAWWRIRYSDVSVSAVAAQQLRETYWLYAIHAAKFERQVGQVCAALRSTGVEPILIKGWAIGRLYPECGLRPTGDIDLCVSPDQLASAQGVLNRSEYYGFWVDLEHDEITKFGEWSFGELYDRSELVNLDGTDVRVLGAEDHLRVLCVHLLKHGAWRPLWLCDVAAALESRPSTFDWDRCLGKNKRQATWVLCTFELANRLLGAQTGDAPLRGNGKSIPGWLIPSVLQQWSRPHPRTLPLIADQLKNCLRQPSALLRYLPKRWPNPIQASVNANAEFDERSRLPLQVRHCLVRAVKLLRWS